MAESPEQDQIRHARGKFFAMATTFALGVFNDNFFKQAALLLAVAAGHTDMQGYALAIFTLPFVALSAPAGWVSDRFPKRLVVIGAKTTEFIAMLFGAAGICLGNWFLIFAMLAIMGFQATFLSPAINGSIPELYPESYIPRANGILRVVVTAAILLGIALAGIALDRDEIVYNDITLGLLVVGGTVVCVAMLGLAVSFKVPYRTAADPTVRFPWYGPLHTLKHLWELRHDPLLATTIGASVFVWSIGSLQVLIINPMGLTQFHFTETMTSGLLVAQLVGVSLGGVLSGWLVNFRNWTRFVALFGVLMSLSMMSISFVPSLQDPRAQITALYALIGLLGIAGGMVLIPVESFIQFRPAPEQKGQVIAAANFGVFGGIFISSFVSNELNDCFTPTDSFGVIGLVSLMCSLALAWGFHTLRARP